MNAKINALSLGVAAGMLFMPAMAMAMAVADDGTDKVRAEAAKSRPGQWQGWHVGLDLGAGFNTGDQGELEFTRVDGSDNSAAIDNAFGDNFDGKFDAGALISLRAGHDWQVDEWVYGLIVDIADTDFSQDQTAFSATPASYVERRELKNLANLRGRVGWAGHRTILPYVSAGLAYGDVEYTWEGDSGAFRGDNGRDGGWTAGYTLGAGVEVAINSEMSFGFEYGYTNLGDENFRTRFDGGPNDPLGMGGATMAFGSPASGGTEAEGTDEDFDFHTVRVNFIYRLRE